MLAGQERRGSGLRALLLQTMQETQKNDLSHIHRLEYYTTGRYMELDLTARRNLELTETLRDKSKRGSLLWVLDQTKTAMGGRLLRSWLEQPLLDPVEIGRRQGAVEELVGNPVARGEVEACLKEISDLERVMTRIVYRLRQWPGSCEPRPGLPAPAGAEGAAGAAAEPHAGPSSGQSGRDAGPPEPH